jgi:NitT/TauT family transport system substrate-binding protein
MKKISILCIAVVLALVFVLVGCNSNPISQNNETTAVKIAYLPVVQGLPMYLAIEKGYFQDAGIEVEAVKFDSPNLIIDALLSGQVDLGSPSTATGITAITQIKKPNSLKIFALNGGNYEIINDVLITQKDSNLETIKDLKGKRLGIIPGIQFRTIAKHILEQNNLTVDDVKIIDIGPPLQVQALAQGQVDAVLTLEPIRTIAIKKGIGKDLVTVPMSRYIGSPWYGGGGVVNVEFAQNNPNTTEKIMNIFNKATDELNANPDEARQYLKNYTALDDELIMEVPLPIYKMYKDFNQEDLDSLQQFFDIFYTHSVIDEKADVQKIIYSPNK